MPETIRLSKKVDHVKNGEELIRKTRDIIDDYNSQNQNLTKIIIDGEAQEGLDINILLGSISKNSEIDLEFRPKKDLAIEALDSCNEYIETIIKQIKECCAMYQGNHTDEAVKKFSETIELIDLFIQLITNIHRTFRQLFGEKYKKDEQIQQLEMHLLAVLKALIPAKEKNDIIMLCDLLEYELVDNLTQWKIKMIPQLKTSTQNL